jgi:hypothetical protein
MALPDCSPEGCQCDAKTCMYVSLTWKTGPENSCDVLVVCVLVDLNRTNCVEHKNRIVAVRGDVRNHGVCALPQGQVLTVAEVVLDVDEALSRICVREHQANTAYFSHTLGKQFDLSESAVVGDRLVRAIARCDFVLNSCVRADQIREVTLTAAPANTKSSNVAAMVPAAVRSGRVRSGIFANNRGQLFLICQGQRSFRVLEQDGRCSADFSDELSMLAANIDMLVDNASAPSLSDVSMDGSFGEWSPGLEVGQVNLIIAVDEVPACKNADDHVIQTPLRHSTVEYGNGEVGSEITLAISELSVARHCHVQSGEDCGDT